MSLLVWRDAKSDPPKGPVRKILAQRRQGDVREVYSDGYSWTFDIYALWAESPVVSDLTDDDVRLAADELRLRAGDNVFDGVRGAESLYQASDRLHAALGGEKEGT